MKIIHMIDERKEKLKTRVFEINHRISKRNQLRIFLIRNRRQKTLCALRSVQTYLHDKALLICLFNAHSIISCFKK